MQTITNIEYIKRNANCIGSTLLSEGMIYGLELENYLKCESDFLKLETEADYFLLENLVLDYIDRHKNYIKVLDTKNKKEKRFDTLKETREALKTTIYKLDAHIKKQKLLHDRYLITIVNTSVKELAYVD